MPISLTCPCGKKIRVNEAKAGKRVKCPECDEILDVPSPSTDSDEIAPPRNAKRKKIDDESNDGAPRKKSKAATMKTSATKTSSMKLLVIGGLGLVLLGGCVGGIGLALWFLVFAGGRADLPYVGAWVLDLEATKTMNPAKWKNAPPYSAYEFNADETYQTALDYRTNGSQRSGKWKILKSEKGEWKVNLHPAEGGIGDTVHLMLKGKDQLYLKSELYKNEYAFKRASEFPTAPPYKDAELYAIQPRVQFDMGMGKGDERKVRRLFLSRDGRRVAASNQGNINNKPAPGTQLWDTTTDAKKLQEFQGTAGGFSPSGSRIILSKGIQTHLVDAISGKEVGEIGWFGDFVYQTETVFWLKPPEYYEFNKAKKLVARKFDSDSLKNSMLYTMGDDDRGQLASQSKETGEFVFVATANQVYVWNSATGKETRRIPLTLDAGETLDLPWGGKYAAVSSDQKWLATRTKNSSEQTAVIVDLTTGNVAQKLSRQISFTSPLFVPNRDILLLPGLASPSQGLVNAYDLRKKLIVATFGPTDAPIERFVISADGSTLAAGTTDGKIAIWDMNKLK